MADRKEGLVREVTSLAIHRLRVQEEYGQPAGADLLTAYVFNNSMGREVFRDIFRLVDDGKTANSLDYYLDRLKGENLIRFAQAWSFAFVGTLFPELMRDIIDPFSTRRFLSRLNDQYQGTPLPSLTPEMLCPRESSEEKIHIAINGMDRQLSENVQHVIINRNPDERKKIGFFFRDEATLTKLPPVNRLLVICGKNRFRPDVLLAGQVFQEVLDGFNERASLNKSANS